MKRLPGLIFAWAKRHWIILTIIAAAAVVRLWHLGSLPPGITPAEAVSGLAGLSLIHHGSLWSWGITPVTMLYSWLAAPFLLLPRNLFWLRLPAALAGVAAVIITYAWLARWRSRRDGLIGAVVIATLAWSVAISRQAGPASLEPALIAGWLWLATARPLTAPRRLGLAALTSVSLYAAPELWWPAAAALIWLLLSRRVWRRSNLPAMGLGLALALPAVIWAALNWHLAAGYFDAAGAISRLAGFVGHVVAAGGDWQQTVGAQPLLNAFYAIMAVLGLVMAILRWKTGRWLVAPLAIGLIVGALSPDGQGFTLCLVPLVGLVVLGTATMLEWWYATFPINAAARSSGRTAIGLILALAAYQGYVQYFVAFANSSLTYTTFREDAWSLALAARANPQAIILTDQPARSIISFAAYPSAPHFVTVKQLVTSHPAGHYFLIGYSQRGAAEVALAGFLPGGRLQPKLSPFDSRDLYYIYQVKP